MPLTLRDRRPTLKREQGWPTHGGSDMPTVAPLRAALCLKCGELISVSEGWWCRSPQAASSARISDRRLKPTKSAAYRRRAQSERFESEPIL